MFNWTLSQELLRLKKLHAVTEAPEDTTIETGVTNAGGGEDDELGGSTDYDAAAAEMDDADQDGTPDEGTETDENEVEDMEADDYSEDTEGEETGEDMEADDYSEDTEGEETPEETEPEPPADTGDKTKNRYLIREYINLYNHLEVIIKKLNNKTKTEILSNRVYLQVINNLTDIQQVLYEYIRDDFSDKSYVFNLYQFNLFLEFINVNAEILDKNNELESKEQTNK